MTRDEASGITCALFHDSIDGFAFGRLISGELLRSFVSLYGETLDKAESQGINTKDFQGFHAKIVEVSVFL